MTDPTRDPLAAARRDADLVAGLVTLVSVLVSVAVVIAGLLRVGT